MSLLLRLLLLPAAAAVLLPLVLLNALSLAVVDGVWFLLGRRPRAGALPEPPAEVPAYAPPRSLSVVIPSWNARDLLEKFLPSVVRAARFHADNEVIVVDNA